MSPSAHVLATTICGPILIGTFINLILYGTSVAQVYFYYTSYYKTDKLWMRLMIGALFILDTLNSIFDMVYIYGLLINHFGDTSEILFGTWTLNTTTWITAIIGVIVQGFFGWRVLVLTKSNTMAFISWTLALVSFGGGVAAGVYSAIYLNFADYSKLKPALSTWLGGSALNDVYITCVLVWYLRGHKTGISSTDDLVDSIIRLTLQTGLITAVVAVIDLSLYLGINLGSYHLIFNYTLPKLYTNSLLSSLNSRKGWGFSSYSESERPSGPVTVSGGRRGPNEVFNLSQLQSTGQTRTQVFVHTEETTDGGILKQDLDYKENRMHDVAHSGQ